MIKRILEASKVTILLCKITEVIFISNIHVFLHGQIMLKKRLISPQLAKLFLNARDLALRHLISTQISIELEPAGTV